MLVFSGDRLPKSLREVLPEEAPPEEFAVVGYALFEVCVVAAV